MLGTIPPRCCCRDGHTSRRFPERPLGGVSSLVAGTAACRLGRTGHDSGATSLPPATEDSASGDGKGPASSSTPRRERATQRSGVARALETKFLRFETGQERDGVPSRYLAPAMKSAVSAPDDSDASNLAGPDPARCHCRLRVSKAVDRRPDS